ncbi:hypothetical protein HanIR_Chr12g0574491 [Helianthus annuus]|nr:hypothetical protein HanIR_Chr12g0574491 [Helianthus annuus]
MVGVGVGGAWLGVLSGIATDGPFVLVGRLVGPVVRLVVVGRGFGIIVFCLARICFSTLWANAQTSSNVQYGCN